MTRPRLILLIRCAVLAAVLWLSAEGVLLMPVALMMPPSILGGGGPTCFIYSDDFSTDNLATDYTTISGSFSVSGGECSTTTSSLIIADATSSTSHGRASVKAKSSATGNRVRVVGAYSGGSYIYAELYFNGASSTWTVSTSGGTQIGPTRTVSLSTSTYYTLTICWDGTAVNAILADSSAVCMAVIHGTSSATGDQAGFGATMSSGTATFDDFSFVHAGELVSGVTCDSCTADTDMTSSACSCSKCDPVWYGELDVDVSGIALGTGCASCSGLNGLFRLTRQDNVPGVCDGSTLCCWSYTFSGGCCGPNTIDANLSNSGSTYTLTVRILYTAGGSPGTCPGGTSTSPLSWSKTYTGKPDCASWSGESVSTFAGDPIGARCSGASATVTVTAADDI